MYAEPYWLKHVLLSSPAKTCSCKIEPWYIFSLHLEKLWAAHTQSSDEGGRAALYLDKMGGTAPIDCPRSILPWGCSTESQVHLDEAKEETAASREASRLFLPLSLWYINQVIPVKARS